MYTALLFAQRSKDPNTQVGCCIVDEDNKVIGVGYNGLPRGCADADFTWSRDKSTDNKYLYVVHAEQNAIANSDRSNLKQCKLFSTHFPCNECAKDIIQAGIKDVFYHTMKHQGTVETTAAIRMFAAAGVSVTKYEPVTRGVNLTFNTDLSGIGDIADSDDGDCDEWSTACVHGVE